MSERESELLARLPLFRSVPAASLEALMRAGRLRYLGIGERVLTQGEPATSAILLVSGLLEVSVATEAGQHHVGEVHPGELVGEQGLFVAQGRRNATVMCNRPSRILTLTPDLLIEQRDSLAIVALEQHLIATIARRIRKTNLEIQKAWKAAQQEEEAAKAPASLSFRQRLRAMLGGGR